MKYYDKQQKNVQRLSSPACQPRRMQSQIFQTIRRKDAGIAPAKGRLHHKPRVYIQIARTAAIPGSSPFYCSDVYRMLVDIAPMRMYTLISEIISHQISQKYLRLIGKKLEVIIWILYQKSPITIE